MTIILIVVVAILLIIVGLAIFLQDPREIDEEVAQEVSHHTDEEIRRDLTHPTHVLTSEELDQQNEEEVDAQR